MNINKTLDSLTKQKLVGGLVPGAILQMWGGAQVYQGIVNSLLLIATAYNTTLRTALSQYFPWLNFWLFFVLLLGGNLIMMLFHYKYIQPSIMAFNAVQGYRHQNPAVTDLQEIRNSLARIEKWIQKCEERDENRIDTEKSNES